MVLAFSHLKNFDTYSIKNITEYLAQLFLFIYFVVCEKNKHETLRAE